MSDTKQADGWWKAADHKWYPPEQAPLIEQGFHSADTEAVLLEAWEQLHGDNSAGELIRGSATLPADVWRRFDRSRWYESSGEPGQGMFVLGERRMVAVEVNSETTEFVVGELGNVEHATVDGAILAITSRKGDVFRLLFEADSAAAEIGAALSGQLGYFNIGEPRDDGHIEHLSVTAVLTPSGALRPQADTNAAATGTVTQTWADQQWFVAVPGNLREPLHDFMSRAGAAGWELVAAVPLGYSEAKTLGEALLGNLAIRDQRLSTLRAQHLHFKRRRVVDGGGVDR